MAETAQDRFAKGIACLNAGDTAGAEAHFRVGAASAPPHPLAVLQLGVILLNRQAFAEAEPILRQAVALQPTVDSVTAFAALMTATNQTKVALQCYGDILKALPDHVPTLKRMAKLCEQIGDRRGTRAYYKRAWDGDPTDLEAGIGYGLASFRDDPAETAAVMDRLVTNAQTDLVRLNALNSLLLYKEFYERTKRGLMLGHATSLDELFFTYCATDFALFRDLALKAAEEFPVNVGALSRKFTALFCSGDRLAAQECLERFQPAFEKNASHIWSAVTFDPAFYRKLEGMSDADILGKLPPLLKVLPAAFSDAPVVYLSCNYTYFTAFAMPMIRSLADTSPGGQLHMHIMDATDAQLQRAAAFCRELSALTIAISAERPGMDNRSKQEARAYYHAIRFIRYYQTLIQTNRTLWLMDVDALIHRNVRELYHMLGDKDAAMRVRAGRFEPWNQFNASVVAATPSAPSTLYFRLIAAYVAHFYQRNGLRWGIDQCAMYGVFEYLRDGGRAPTLALLNDRAVDYDYIDDGIVWCNSGRNKFAHVNRNPDGSLVIDDPDRAIYLKLFDKYYVPDSNIAGTSDDANG